MGRIMLKVRCFHILIIRRTLATRLDKVVFEYLGQRQTLSRSSSVIVLSGKAVPLMLQNHNLFVAPLCCTCSQTKLRRFPVRRLASTHGTKLNAADVFGSL